MATQTQTPSLTLQAMLLQAAKQAALHDRTAQFDGLTAPAKALAVAMHARTAPVMVVVPGDRDIDRFVNDARFFLGVIEALAAQDVERAVVAFPSEEVDPYRGLLPHFDVASARARALHALARGTARIVVASIAALFPRLSPPDRVTHATIDLRPGEDFPLDVLRSRLAEAGFTAEDPVDEHGEFCIRGGVVDVFPAGDMYPLRIEFVGDTVESIRRFDPSTQRSVETVDHALIVPVREHVSDASADGLAVSDRSATVFDYTIRRNMRWFTSETHAIDVAGLKYEAQLANSYADALARNPIAPEPTALALPWSTLVERLSGAVRLEELALGGAPSSDDAGALDAVEHAGPDGRDTPERGHPAASASPTADDVDTADEPPADDRPRLADAAVASTAHVEVQPAPEYRGRVQDWVADIRRARERRDTVVFVVATTGRAERTIELLREYDVVAVNIDRAESMRGAAVVVAHGRLSHGFRLGAAGLQLIAETDVFDDDRQRHERRRSAARTFLSDFRDLKIGDMVVHVDHGIGVFVGLKKLSVGADAQEFMELRYAGEDKLFVPVERLDLVQKYSGAVKPSLDKLGGTTWEKARTRVKKTMRDMADELLKLYASRKAVQGHAFNVDTHWQEEFEGAFEYDLTPDQATAIADIKKDMESSTPMDRLLCGDVGYGKTEVAMRAAFKAVMDGKQVAVLAPTTVLAFQHEKTLRQRFAAFPVTIEQVSRFKSKPDQKTIFERLAAGKLDILVGTHRLLSKDVVFHDLGLLIVDEEQRFGVSHKEKIKQLRKKVDVLTLSATPIPRTLNMSLVGIRDMSVIETPPRDRQSIQTNVIKFDQQVISSAIRHELERGGQVYFVHNRVESIYSMAGLLQRLVPEARVGVGHGQLAEHQLEAVMLGFVNRQYDVLLATTIIENGLDIPNANTMIINRADRYGLAQLYQLRGRVGRSDRRAYAYLLIPPEAGLSPVARKRLAAIKEFSDLGSGFRVAALDLEIRGAGNLLGGEQSGHIEAIGFEMYMKLLEETIRELQGEDLEDDVRAHVNLKLDLRIDEQYIPDMNQRLSVYRRIAAARSEAQLADLLQEVRDRYGPPPASLAHLEGYARIRIAADALRLEAIDREGNTVLFKFREKANVDPIRLMKLLERRQDLALVPPSTVKLSLVGGVIAPRLASPRQAPPPRKTHPRYSQETSWWTQRATADAVTPGFSKQEITRELPPDPCAPGGLYERIGGFMAELADKA